MKRFWILMLAFLLVLGVTSISLAATQIKDVDSSHWAYKSVKLLIEKGYMSLYEDSTFRGDKTVTRYQLAEVVAKLLEKVNNGTLTVAAGDANDIRKLVVEFENELVEIIHQQNLFADKITQIEKNQVVVNENVAESKQEILQLINDLVQLKQLNEDLTKANEEEIKAIKAQIALIEKKMADGLAFSITGIADLTQQIEDVKTEVEAQNEADAVVFQTLEEENARLKAETTRLSEESSKLAESNELLKLENAQIKEDIEALKRTDVRHIYYIIAAVVISAVIVSFKN